MAFKQVAMKRTEIQGVPSPQNVNFQAAITKLTIFSSFYHRIFITKSSNYSFASASTAK